MSNNENIENAPLPIAEGEPMDRPTPTEETASFMDTLNAINDNPANTLSGRQYLMTVLQTTVLIVMLDRIQAMLDQSQRPKPYNK